MSKYSKALSSEQNSIFDWQVEAITKSRKVGRTLDGHEAMRSKLFWMRLPDGKILDFFYISNHNRRFYRFTQIVSNQ